MELKKFLKIFTENLIFIVMLALGAAITTLMSANFLHSGYSISRVYFVSAPNQTETLQGYNFDSFFRGENARNFTDTVVAILESEDFTGQVLEKGAALTTRKLAPQVVRITLSGENPQNLNQDIEKLALRFNMQIAELEGSSSSQLKPIGGVREPAFFALNKPILFVFGFVLGATIALFIIGLKNYFRL